MAEPFSIIGLTSNIICFIEFGLRVVSATQAVRASKHGTTPEIHELEIIIDDVRSCSAEALRKRPGGGKLSQDELRMVDIAKECDRLVQELSAEVEKLKVRDGVRSKTLTAARVALRAGWKRADINGLRDRLEALDGRMRANLATILQGKRHSDILAQLIAIEQAHEKFKINYESKLDNIREDIVNLAKRNQDVSALGEESQLISLRTKLEILERERHIGEKQAEVIKSLYFPELRRRRSQIPEAAQSTNSWLFDSSETTFVNWLERKEGMYWISGWAGSGKSTLMKFASEHPRTLTALKQWAGPAECYIASHFFWNQGFEMQKSQIGLLQTLLYQILTSSPSLIPIVCPARLHHEAWEMEDLQSAFQNIAVQTTLPYRYCFFIDGLDEYSGDEEEIVRVLTFLSKSNHVKICASSRPRLIFEEFFTDGSLTLILQDHTREDMQRYVRQRLYECKKLCESKDLQCYSEEIVERISDQAQGVWLWVDLVTRDLVHAINRNEGIPILRKIIRQFPPDLTSYFERIMNGIKKEFREEMAQIFLIAIDALEPLPLFAYSLLERERLDPNYALTVPSSGIHGYNTKEFYTTWKCRIQNRCGDLLVVEDSVVPGFGADGQHHTVDFLHRTVRDFLRDCAYPRLKEESGSAFSPALSMTRIMLFVLKSYPNITNPACDFCPVPSHLIHFIFYYAHEAERQLESAQSPLPDLLDETGRIYRGHIDFQGFGDFPSFHLSNAHFFDRCSPLEAAVQARLFKYVHSCLQSYPPAIHLNERSLLEFALQPHFCFIQRMFSEIVADDVDARMVRLLLEHGSDPNKILRGKSDWERFLTYHHRYPDLTRQLPKSWYPTCELLIRYGARCDSRICKDPRDMIGRENVSWAASDLLDEIFGEDRAAALIRLSVEVEAQSWRQWFPKLSQFWS